MSRQSCANIYLMFTKKEEASCNIVTHSFARMEDRSRYATPEIAYNVAAFAHQEVFQQQLNIHRFIRGRVRWRRGARACSIMVRPWLHPERRRQFGIYDQLMLELRREDPRTFKKFHYGRSFEISKQCPNNVANILLSPNVKLVRAV